MADDSTDASATDADATTADAEATTTTGVDDTGDRSLGAPGEKALEHWKTRAKAAEAKAKEAAALSKEVEELRDAKRTELERAVERARKEGETQALQNANSKIVRLTIRSLARETFADPSDADVIDAAQFEVDDDGNVDEKAVSEALAALLKEKPHYRKATDSKKTSGSADQGARGAAPTPTSMNSLIRQQAGHG